MSTVILLGMSNVFMTFGVPFDPGRGRLMKEWLTVASAKASWIDLAVEAHAFVNGKSRSGPCRAMSNQNKGAATSTDVGRLSDSMAGSMPTRCPPNGPPPASAPS